MTTPDHSAVDAALASYEQAVSNVENADAAQLAQAQAQLADAEAEIATLKAELYNPLTFTYGDFGSYKPDATTTGVPAGTVLTAHAGDLTVTADGSTIDSLDIAGRLLIQARNVTVTRCRIRGNLSSGGGAGAVHCAKSNTNISGTLIADCDIIPDTPTTYTDGIWGHDFTLLRCNIRHVHHGVYATHVADSYGTDTNVTVKGCYIHHLGFFSPDPTHSDNKSHNDAIHWEGGSGLTAIGNNLPAFLSKAVDASGLVGPDPEGYVGVADNPTPTGGVNPYYPHPQGNAALQIGSAMQGNPANLNFTQNWVDGGACTINVAGSLPFTNCSITNNRFGRGADGPSHNGNSGYVTIGASKPGITGAGNVFDDDGTPITWR